jgi:hypothetical protein
MTRDHPMNYPEEVEPVASPPQERLQAALRIGLLTNFIHPYRLPVFQEIAGRCGVVSSARLDAHGSQPALGCRFRAARCRFAAQSDAAPQVAAPSGFEETMYLHFPWDTLWQLLRYRPDVVISGEFGFRTLNALIYKLLSRSKLVIWEALTSASGEK